MRYAALLFLFTSLAWSQATGTIHGTVKDESTGAPLEAFQIFIGDTQLKRGEGIIMMPPTRTTSDEEGHYEVAALPPGNVRITASKRKGPSVTRNVTVTAGEDLTVDFLIPTSPTISGRVTRGEDQPAVDAAVWLLRSDYEAGVLHQTAIGPEITGEDGTYAFTKDLEAGRSYYVVVDSDRPEKDGADPVEVPTYYGNAATFDAASPVLLRRGEKHEQTNIRLRTASPYCVDGKVQFTTKKPPESLILHEQALSGTMLTRGRIDPGDDAKFRLCGLTPAAYAVSADDMTVADFVIAGSDVHNLLVNVDRATLHLNLAWDGDPPASPNKKEPLSVPPGKFSAEAAKILQSALLAIGGPQGSEIAIALERAGDRALHGQAAPFDGPFGREFSAGDYALDLQAAPGSYVKQIDYNGVPVTDGMLHLAPGTNGTLRVVASQGSGGLACQVSDSDNKPVGDAIVLVLPRSATTAAQIARLGKNMESQPDGSAAMRDLAPGKYKVLALTHPYQMIPEDLDKLALMLSQAQDVEVASGGAAQVKLSPLTIPGNN